MRTIKTYSKRAPFYNAFTRTYGCLEAMRLLGRLAERSKDNWIAGCETGLCECGHIIRELEN